MNFAPHDRSAVEALSRIIELAGTIREPSSIDEYEGCESLAIDIIDQGLSLLDSVSKSFLSVTLEHNEIQLSVIARSSLRLVMSIDACGSIGKISRSLASSTSPHWLEQYRTSISSKSLNVWKQYIKWIKALHPYIVKVGGKKTHVYQQESAVEKPVRAYQSEDSPTSQLENACARLICNLLHRLTLYLNNATDTLISELTDCWRCDNRENLAASIRFASFFAQRLAATIALLTNGNSESFNAFEGLRYSGISKQRADLSAHLSEESIIVASARGLLRFYGSLLYFHKQNSYSTGFQDPDILEDRPSYLESVVTVEVISKTTDVVLKAFTHVAKRSFAGIQRPLSAGSADSRRNKISSRIEAAVPNLWTVLSVLEGALAFRGSAANVAPTAVGCAESEHNDIDQDGESSDRLFILLAAQDVALQIAHNASVWTPIPPPQPPHPADTGHALPSSSSSPSSYSSSSSPSICSQQAPHIIGTDWRKAAYIVSCKEHLRMVLYSIDTFLAATAGIITMHAAILTKPSTAQQSDSGAGTGGGGSGQMFGAMAGSGSSSLSQEPLRALGDAHLLECITVLCSALVRAGCSMTATNCCAIMTFLLNQALLLDHRAGEMRNVKSTLARTVFCGVVRTSCLSIDGARGMFSDPGDPQRAIITHTFRRFGRYTSQLLWKAFLGSFSVSASLPAVTLAMRSLLLTLPITFGDGGEANVQCAGLTMLGDLLRRSFSLLSTQRSREPASASAVEALMCSLPLAHILRAVGALVADSAVAGIPEQAMSTHNSIKEDRKRKFSALDHQPADVRLSCSRVGIRSEETGVDGVGDGAEFVGEPWNAREIAMCVLHLVKASLRGILDLAVLSDETVGVLSATDSRGVPPPLFPPYVEQCSMRCLSTVTSLPVGSAVALLLNLCSEDWSDGAERSEDIVALWIDSLQSTVQQNNDASAVVLSWITESSRVVSNLSSSLAKFGRKIARDVEKCTAEERMSDSVYAAEEAASPAHSLSPLKLMSILLCGTDANSSTERCQQSLSPTMQSFLRQSRCISSLLGTLQSLVRVLQSMGKVGVKTTSAAAQQPERASIRVVKVVKIPKKVQFFLLRSAVQCAECTRSVSAMSGELLDSVASVASNDAQPAKNNPLAQGMEFRKLLDTLEAVVLTRVEECVVEGTQAACLLVESVTHCVENFQESNYELARQVFHNLAISSDSLRRQRLRLSALLSTTRLLLLNQSLAISPTTPSSSSSDEPTNRSPIFQRIASPHDDPAAEPRSNSKLWQAWTCTLSALNDFVHVAILARKTNKLPYTVKQLLPADFLPYMKQRSLDRTLVATTQNRGCCAVTSTKLAWPERLAVVAIDDRLLKEVSRIVSCDYAMSRHTAVAINGEHECADICSDRNRRKENDARVVPPIVVATSGVNCEATLESLLSCHTAALPRTSPHSETPSRKVASRQCDDNEGNDRVAPPTCVEGNGSQEAEERSPACEVDRWKELPDCWKGREMSMHSNTEGVHAAMDVDAPTDGCVDRLQTFRISDSVYRESQNDRSDHHVFHTVRANPAPIEFHSRSTDNDRGEPGEGSAASILSHDCQDRTASSAYLSAVSDSRTIAPDDGIYSRAVPCSVICDDDDAARSGHVGRGGGIEGFEEGTQCSNGSEDDGNSLGKGMSETVFRHSVVHKTEAEDSPSCASASAKAGVIAIAGEKEEGSAFSWQFSPHHNKGNEGSDQHSPEDRKSCAIDHAFDQAHSKNSQSHPQAIVAREPGEKERLIRDKRGCGIDRPSFQYELLAQNSSELSGSVRLSNVQCGESWTGGEQNPQVIEPTIYQPSSASSPRGSSAESLRLKQPSCGSGEDLDKAASGTTPVINRGVTRSSDRSPFSRSFPLVGSCLPSTSVSSSAKSGAAASVVKMGPILSTLSNQTRCATAAQLDAAVAAPIYGKNGERHQYTLSQPLPQLQKQSQQQPYHQPIQCTQIVKSVVLAGTIRHSLAPKQTEKAPKRSTGAAADGLEGNHRVLSEIATLAGGSGEKGEIPILAEKAEIGGKFFFDSLDGSSVSDTDEPSTPISFRRQLSDPARELPDLPRVPGDQQLSPCSSPHSLASEPSLGDGNASMMINDRENHRNLSFSELKSVEGAHGKRESSSREIALMKSDGLDVLKCAGIAVRDEAFDARDGVGNFQDSACSVSRGVGSEQQQHIGIRKCVDSVAHSEREHKRPGNCS